jgi:transposase-like protein
VEKNDQQSRSKYGRRFDEEFKRDAVRMLESRARTAEQLAGELEVSVWSLKREAAYERISCTLRSSWRLSRVERS